jgi:hypothetical protein
MLTFADVAAQQHRLPDASLLDSQLVRAPSSPRRQLLRDLKRFQGSEGHQRWHRLTIRVDPTALPNTPARTYSAVEFYNAGVVRVTEIEDAGENMLQRLRTPGCYHTRPRDMCCGGAFSASPGYSYRTWLARTQEIQTRIPVAATQLRAFERV